MSATPKDWKAEYEAPKGQTWVCAACGKSGPNFLNAGLCYAQKDLETGYWKAVTNV